jgi:dipeptidyl aminopeptidase/acylaminoacyl peptidase
LYILTPLANAWNIRILLGAPRRSSATPSADGKYALYSQSSYSFESHSKTSEIRVLDIASGQSALLSNDFRASEPKWLGDGHEVVWLKEGENGNTSFVVSDALENGWTYVAGTVPGPLSSLKLYTIEPGMIAVAVAGQANPDGSLHNPKDVSRSQSSARLYDSLFVRHWDAWIGKERNTIWTALLQQSAPHVTERKGRYNLIGFSNALKGTNLESPIPTFGGTNHFDVSREGIVFVARDPDLDPATHTRCYAYFIRRTDLMGLNVSDPIKLLVPGLEGWATSPAFSPDGQKICALYQKIDGYESDKNRIVVFLNVVEGVELLQSDDGKGLWDRSPSSVMWSVDGSSLLAQAEDLGSGCLFEIPFDPSSAPEHQPRKLTSKNYISDVVPAASNSNKLFVSSTSLVDNSIYYILDPSRPEDIMTVSSGNLFGLSESQVSSIWWRGANDHPVHAWMVRPSFFKPEHKYPLCFLVHGGPQGAWGDQWSTRWNPAVFAEQGYVVVAPNPTGSTGFGQDFTDAIKNEWGGLPYEDLVKGFEHIEKEIDFIDTDRAVALGASYGGYMMNWIQGHDLGRKFKALVCHDGVFSMTAQCASDEQYFPVHDLGGPLWERQEMWDKWDPSRFTRNWSTPQLVIHSSLDYRLTVGEGLAAFNVLQMRGVESLFLNFPDENHFVLKQENSLVWHQTVINFINKFVGLPPLLDREGKTGLEGLQNNGWERGQRLPLRS